VSDGVGIGEGSGREVVGGPESRLSHAAPKRIRGKSRREHREGRVLFLPDCTRPLPLGLPYGPPTALRLVAPSDLGLLRGRTRRRRTSRAKLAYGRLSHFNVWTTSEKRYRWLVAAFVNVSQSDGLGDPAFDFLCRLWPPFLHPGSSFVALAVKSRDRLPRRACPSMCAHVYGAISLISGLKFDT